MLFERTFLQIQCAEHVTNSEVRSQHEGLIGEANTILKTVRSGKLLSGFDM